MNPLAKSVVSGAVVGACAFAIACVREYLYLQAHQPGAVPLDQATAFPPSAAWFPAATVGLSAFVLTAVIAFAVGHRAKN